LEAERHEAALPFRYCVGAHPFLRGFVSLAPRGTSGERAGERGIFQRGLSTIASLHNRTISIPPLPSPLLHTFVEESETEAILGIAKVSKPTAGTLDFRPD
jgi:hypothetical protein